MDIVCVVVPCSAEYILENPDIQDYFKQDIETP